MLYHIVPVIFITGYIIHIKSINKYMRYSSFNITKVEDKGQSYSQCKYGWLSFLCDYSC